PGLPTARTIRCFRLRVPSPQKSSRLLLIKPAELLLFLTGADTQNRATPHLALPPCGIATPLPKGGEGQSSQARIFQQYGFLDKSHSLYIALKRV
ncbi:MAG: hypothetical protein ACLQVM_13320, partial [Terriglobia bacterium]